MSEVTATATQSGIRKRVCQPASGLRMAGLKRDFVRENVLVTSAAKIHQDKLTAKILHRSNEGSFTRQNDAGLLRPNRSTCFQWIARFHDLSSRLRMKSLSFELFSPSFEFQ